MTQMGMRARTLHRRALRRGAELLGAALLSMMLLAGCATAPGSPPPGESEPTPTAACPMPVDGPQDPGCAYYDPDAAMGLNEKYRERRPITAEVQAAGEALIPVVSAALEAFASGEKVITNDAVRDAIQNAGVDASSLQVNGEPPATVGVAIAIDVGGGCVFGGVKPGAVELEVGGHIRDGGCLPASGH